ncbi:MAG: hypothetical protein U9Q77_04180 [Candidatus Marinimicrobia bacterium]|nr:hypothetical protein [Candidatus Neomarinimicrobiota bacterium]
MKNIIKWIIVLLISSSFLVNCEGKTKKQKNQSTNKPIEKISQDANIKKDSTPSGNPRIIQKQIKSVDDIVKIDAKFVKPIDYTNVISLNELTVLEKKEKIY